MSRSKILIVDDESKMTKLLKILLEEEIGCQATVSNDSTEALELLKTTSFDLLSLNHRMPKLTGMELLNQLRSSPGPNQMCPALIFTGYLSDVRSLHSETLERVLLLEKPINDQRFLRNVQMALKMQPNEIQSLRA